MSCRNRPDATGELNRILERVNPVVGSTVSALATSIADVTRTLCLEGVLIVLVVSALLLCDEVDCGRIPRAASCRLPEMSTKTPMTRKVAKRSGSRSSRGRAVPSQILHYDRVAAALLRTCSQSVHSRTRTRTAGVSYSAQQLAEARPRC